MSSNLFSLDLPNLRSRRVREINRQATHVLWILETQTYGKRCVGWRINERVMEQKVASQLVRGSAFPAHL